MERVIILIVCILGYSTVSAQMCNVAGDSPASTWLVQCYNINSTTINELTSALNYIKYEHFSKYIAVQIFQSVGKDFPDDIFVGYKIVDLTMSQCNLTEIPYGLLANLPRYINHLDFSNNFISDIDSEKFNQLPFTEGLTTLNFENNQLKSIWKSSFLNFTSLTSLDLRANVLQKLEDNAFQGLTALTNLYLHDNHLTSVGANAFETLINLNFLSMELNQITFLTNGTFSIENQPKLREIPLEGNPFYCNCTLQWLKDYLILINYLEASGATCTYPKQLPFVLVDFCSDETESSPSIA